MPPTFVCIPGKSERTGIVLQVDRIIAVYRKDEADLTTIEVEDPRYLAGADADPTAFLSAQPPDVIFALIREAQIDPPQRWSALRRSYAYVGVLKAPDTAPPPYPTSTAPAEPSELKVALDAAALSCGMRTVWYVLGTDDVATAVFAPIGREWTPQ